MKGSKLLDQYFETLGLTGGVLVIFGIGIVIFLLVAVVLELKTRKLFPDRKTKRGEGGLFDFDDEDED